jgi:drug/metabolite transporter (DMT)-like permease
MLALACAALIFSVMALFAKEASTRLPGPQIAFVRFLFGLAACGLVSLRVPLRARNKRGLVLRGALGGAAVLCFFLAIEHLPVGLATLLNYTAPVFTAIWAALFLDEPLDAGVVLALALATGGVALVATANAPGAPIGFGRWVLVGAMSAVLSGAAVATIREVRRTDGSWEIFASLCAAGALITGVPALRSWVAPTQHEWWLLAGVGVTSVVAQVGFTWAMRYVRAAAAGVIAQLTPVGALALGWLVYNDRITPLAALGAAVTLTGVSWGAWHATRGTPVLPEDA